MDPEEEQAEAAAREETTRLFGEAKYHLGQAITTLLALHSVTKSASINQAIVRSHEARFWVEQGDAMNLFLQRIEDQGVEAAVEEQAEHTAALTDDPEDTKELLN